MDQTKKEELLCTVINVGGGFTDFVVDAVGGETYALPTSMEFEQAAGAALYVEGAVKITIEVIGRRKVEPPAKYEIRADLSGVSSVDVDKLRTNIADVIEGATS